MLRQRQDFGWARSGVPSDFSIRGDATSVAKFENLAEKKIVGFAGHDPPERQVASGRVLASGLAAVKCFSYNGL